MREVMAALIVFVVGWMCGRGYTLREELRWLKQQVREKREREQHS